MSCPIHKTPRPHLCHDCARDINFRIQLGAVALRITEEDSRALRIILEPGRKAVTVVRR